MAHYSTPDGSIWEASPHEPFCFNRVAGKDHEDDYRAQKLDEVLRHWGPLSFYDPLKEAREATLAAMRGAGWKTVCGPNITAFMGQLNHRGYEIAKLKEG